MKSNHLNPTHSIQWIKFGDGHKAHSHEKGSLPANISGVNVFIEIEIVKEKNTLAQQMFT